MLQIYLVELLRFQLGNCIRHPERKVTIVELALYGSLRHTVFSLDRLMLLIFAVIQCG